MIPISNIIPFRSSKATRIPTGMNLIPVGIPVPIVEEKYFPLFRYTYTWMPNEEAIVSIGATTAKLLKAIDTDTFLFPLPLLHRPPLLFHPRHTHHWSQWPSG